MLLNKKQLRNLIPISDSTIAKLEKEGRFPKRRVLGDQKVVWIKAEIEAWIESLACSSSAAGDCNNIEEVRAEGRK